MFQKFSEFINSNKWEAKMLIIFFKIVIVLLVGFIIIKVVTRYVYAYLDKKDSKQSKTIKTVMGSTIKYFTYFIMISIILSLFDINTFVALAGVGGVAIGLGAQTFIKDVISGSFILMEEQFQVDDVVMIEGFMGKVESIGLRTTTLRNVSNNEVYIIPNGEIKIVTNKTKDFQKVSVTFKLKYHENLDEIRMLVSDAVEKYNKDTRLISNVVVNVNADNLEPVINVNVNCSVNNNEAYSVRNDLTNDLTKVFYENNLEIAVFNKLMISNK